MDISLERVDEILLKHNFETSSLIVMLQEIQAEGIRFREGRDGRNKRGLRRKRNP